MSITKRQLLYPCRHRVRSWHTPQTQFPVPHEGGFGHGFASVLDVGLEAVVDSDFGILAFCEPVAVFNDCAAGSKIPPRFLLHSLDHRLDLPNYEIILRKSTPHMERNMTNKTKAHPFTDAPQSKTGLLTESLYRAIDQPR